MELIMAQKAQLQSLINSQGWLILKQLGERIVSEMEHKALNGDDAEIVTLTRRARGAREFWTAFLTDVDTSKAPEVKDEDEFIPVSY